MSNQDQGLLFLFVGLLITSAWLLSGYNDLRRNEVKTIIAIIVILLFAAGLLIGFGGTP